MKTSELIEELKASIAARGDLDVKINSSFSEYSETDVACVVGYRAWKLGDSFPNFTGDAQLLLSADPEDAALSASLPNAQPSDR